jgi:hypothetical protein
MNGVKIIVSRYNENLNWLEEEPFRDFNFIIYNKGENDDFNKTNVVDIIRLPNIGKCDHTYLYHIINNFDNLDDILIFLPGSLNISSKKSKAIEMLERIKINNFQNAVFIGDYSRSILKEFYDFTLSSWCSSSSDNYEKNNSCSVFPANIQPFGRWYLHNFGNIPVNYYTFQGIFSVHKNDILQHSKYRYEKLLQQLEIDAHPEAGHYVERSWGAIFYPMKNTKVLVNKSQYFATPSNVVIRKPRVIRRLPKTFIRLKRKGIFNRK